MNRVAWLIACLVLAASSAAQPDAQPDAQPNADEGVAARAALVKYYETLARKDLDGMTASWSTQMRDAAGYRASLKKWLGRAVRIEFKSLDVLKEEKAKDMVRLRIRLHLAGFTTDGKPVPGFGVTTHSIVLVREKGVWKITGVEVAEAPLARALAAAKTAEARGKLLQADKDIVNRNLIDLLTTWGKGYTHVEDAGAAMRYFDAAIAAAEVMGNKVQLAFCYANRGLWWRHRARIEEALADLSKALELQRAAKNRPGEAAMLFALAIAYDVGDRHKEALQHYEDSLAIQIELKDRRGECHVLNNLGTLYKVMGRYPDALRTLQRSLAIARELNDVAILPFTLNNLGALQERTGQWKEALANFQEALRFARALNDRPHIAEALLNIGTIYEKTGRSAEAFAHFEESLAIRRALADQLGEAFGTCALGDLCAATGKYEEAVRHYEESLKICQALRHRSGEAVALGGLATAEMSLGQYDESRTHFESCLKIIRNLGVKSSEATGMTKLAVLLMRMGHYPEARDYLDKSLKMARALPDPQSEAYALTGLGNLALDEGNYDLALHYHEASLTIARALGDRSGAATSLGNIGNVYQKLGRYAEDIRCQREALQIDRAIGSRGGEASGLLNLAAIYLRTGRAAEALQLDQEALAIYRELKDRPGEASAMLNLGAYYQRTDRLTEALRQYEGGLKVVRAVGARALEPKFLNNMGLVASQDKQFDKALLYFQDALKITRELSDRVGAAGLLENIGTVHLENGRPREALPYFQDALEISRASGHAYGQTLELRDIGNARASLGEWQAAATAYAEAVDAVERVRADTRDPDLQATLLGEYSSPYYGLANALLRLDRPGDAFAASERLRARSLIDLLSGARLDVRKGMTAAERKTDETLRANLTALDTQIENLRRLKVGTQRLAPLLKDQEKSRRELEEARRDLYLKHPDLRSRQAHFEPASLTELNKAIFARRPGLVVLSYLVGTEQTLLFVLSAADRAGGPARLQVHRIEVAKKDLDEAIQGFRDLCQKPPVPPDGGELYRWLLGPAEATLKDAKQIVIIADGALLALPFHALRADEDSPYLVERCAVSYAPSLSALLLMQEAGDRLRRRYGTGGDLLAVGVSDFGKRGRSLPQAEREAAGVAALFGPRGQTRLGANASRAGLEQLWGKARYLHFATHGVLNEAAPFYSAVLLSDGDLLARDLLDADLSAELAVLSACETDLGQQLSGEGVVGLSWAWFVAGVPGVVASQWMVEDTATATLMTAFWSEVKAGTPRAEALRRAQRAVLKDRHTRHPFYWAPFVLVGDLGE